MIKKILLGIALNGLALFGVTYFLTDVQYTGGIKFFLLGGLIIGVLNTFIKPLMKLLSFPFMIMTIGLFSIIINAIIFWLTVKLVNVIHIADVTMTVSGALTYVIAALVFGIVNWLIHIIIKNK